MINWVCRKCKTLGEKRICRSITEEYPPIGCNFSDYTGFEPPQWKQVRVRKIKDSVHKEIIESYRGLLKKFDWFYMYSDNSVNRKKTTAVKDRIRGVYSLMNTTEKKIAISLFKRIAPAAWKKSAGFISFTGI